MTEVPGREGAMPGVSGRDGAADDINEVLRETPLFETLSPEDARALRADVSDVHLDRGERLFSEGDTGDKLYIILAGKIKLTKAAPDGRENLLSVHGPGEMFGELSLFDPIPRTSSATAVTGARLAGLGHEDLRIWLASRPEVAMHLLQALAQRLRRINDVKADLVFTDVPGRVAKALLDLAERFGTATPDGIQVNHDLTQEELAQLVGASRETVNKALADFTARGWIQLAAKSVLVTDPDRLRKRAR
jgi:CRP/FNR family transcriptional regulator, cyclic AMP receptor protein